MSKKYINESQLKSIIYNQVRKYLTENLYLESDKENDRLSDMETETKKEQELRNSVEDYFKKPEVNNAPYAYKLDNVSPQKGKDTNAMKDARHDFAAKLNHTKNEAGYPYSFTSSEVTHLANMISNSSLNEAISRAVNESFKRLNEGQYDESPITKWVYWCFNFPFPQEWIPQIEWNGAGADHFMNKFKEIYQSVGSKGVMNRFFVELDRSNQQKLIEYVMNNY